jgi:hypothetical protein
MRPLFSQATRPARFVGLACGALSGASWTSAFLLGILRELNGRITVLQVLECWAMMVLLAFFAAYTLLLGREAVYGLMPPRFRRSSLSS